MGWLSGEGEGFDVPEGTHGESFTSTIQTGFGDARNQFRSRFPDGRNLFVNPFASHLKNNSDNRIAARTDARPEQIVNAFDAFRDRRNAALERIRNPPGFVNEARITWGGPDDGLPINRPDPTVTDDDDAGGGGEGFNTAPTDRDGKRPNDNKNTPEWRETKRKTQTIKVASEDDPETYIKVQVAIKSLMSTPNGDIIITWISPE